MLLKTLPYLITLAGNSAAAVLLSYVSLGFYLLVPNLLLTWTLTLTLLLSGGCATRCANPHLWNINFSPCVRNNEWCVFLQNEQ